MFTGIVEKIGRITRVNRASGGVRISIETDFNSPIPAGASISCDGACLTVEKGNRRQITVMAVEETLARTKLGQIKTGYRINLERALPSSGRLDGHIVYGHIDTTARITEIIPKGTQTTFRFLLPPGNTKYIVPKGSIAIDGVSLTIANITGSEFEVAIIPFTYKNTNFQFKHQGELVNVEFDVVGKYIERLVCRE
ncbi:MAG: hypothetical protein B6D65_03385 [candidate division Zixibacteria bacterium 4484_93]|nr:MAG: hypothetical protein B6D65_03385 [candidate division Zixibacteria bacterium 4484_93]